VALWKIEHSLANTRNIHQWSRTSLPELFIQLILTITRTNHCFNTTKKTKNHTVNPKNILRNLKFHKNVAHSTPTFGRNIWRAAQHGSTQVNARGKKIQIFAKTKTIRFVTPAEEPIWITESSLFSPQDPVSDSVHRKFFSYRSWSRKKKNTKKKKKKTKTRKKKKKKRSVEGRAVCVCVREDGKGNGVTRLE